MCSFVEDLFELAEDTWELLLGGFGYKANS